MNVCLYGGAFDPPHLAHILATTHLLCRPEIDEVWWLPAADHVFGKDMSPFGERVAMLRETLAALGLGRVRICEVEGQKDRPSRTFETLSELEAVHPEHSFSIAVGGDNIAERHRWFRFDDLVARWPVFVFGRPGYEAAVAEIADAPWCAGVGPTLPDVSSTAIRAAVRVGRVGDVLRWMPEVVAERARALYVRAAEGPAVQILGAGRAGRALEWALRGGGVPVSVWARSRDPELPDLAAARTWLLCVSDGAIPEVAARLARHGAARPGKVALHTAGRLGREALAPLAAAGVSVGSLHPLQSLRGDASDRLAGCYCAVEGDETARAEATRLVRAFGGRVVSLPDGEKAAYHAAAVLSANFATVLGAGGVALLTALGVEPGTARDMLVPLLRGTLDHFAVTEGAAALTGPFARGDLDAVRAHLAAIDRHAPAWRPAYVALARVAAGWLGWDGARQASLEEIVSGR